MVLALIVLPPLMLESFTFMGLLLATIGALFLAYDLLGRENGPLRWFTLVLTCGLVSALVFVPVAILDAVLGGVFKDGFNLLIILPLILFGAFMGFYTVILVDLSPSLFAQRVWNRARRRLCALALLGIGTELC